MTLPGEQQVSALREEIRRTGYRALTVLLLGHWACLGAAATGAIWLSLHGAPWIWDLAFWPLLALLACFPVFGMPLAACYRRSQLRTFAARLQSLPAGQGWEALRALEGEREPQIRRLIRPLLTRFRASHADLTPANAPTGRGDEPSPTQER
jgi:hypothetical protein